MPLPAELNIVFSRTECMGACPVYIVGIHPDLNVYWQGFKNVRVIGDAHKQIARRAFDQLAVAIESARFFEREHDGRLPPPPCKDPTGTTICLRGFSTCSDTSHFKISVGRGDKHNEIDDAGCYGAELDDLRQLERLLEQTAGTSAWIGR